jgi:hypothetical protein
LNEQKSAHFLSGFANLKARTFYESRFDGKWVLGTNTNMSAEKVALNDKELWQVEKAFCDVTSLLDTRSIIHQRDRTMRGHVFCR